MRHNRWAILLSLFVLTGCGSGAQTAAVVAPDESQQLTVYTSHKESVYVPIIREFEERTGIWVNVVTGGTSELLASITQEQDAPVADVMFGGGVESLDFHRACFTPYICAGSERIPDAYLSTGSYWTPFSAIPVVLIYNTRLVNPAELTSWASLSNPQFQGKIAFADPNISGSSFTALVTEIYARKGDVDTSIALLVSALDHQVLADSGEVVSAVADGKCLVGITLEETALQSIEAGHDIAVVYPSDGTSCVPDGSALVRGAPHPDNARLFLDFTVSYDVQTHLSSQISRRPIRSDVPTAPHLPPLADLTLLDYDIDWVCDNRGSILSQWSQQLKGGPS